MADLVEVVRCKDCKYQRLYTDLTMTKVYHDCARLPESYFGSDEEYCCLGERGPKIDGDMKIKIEDGKVVSYSIAGKTFSTEEARKLMEHAFDDEWLADHKKLGFYTPEAELVKYFTYGGDSDV